MGDTTCCRLTVAGILDEKDITRLAEAIDDAYGGPLADLEEAISEGLDGLEFEEVNYAQLDSSLEALLRELCLSYAWEWDGGAEYSSGVQLFDARTGEASGDLSCIGQDIVATLDEAERPGRIAALQRWSNFWHGSWDLAITKSNHELMELAAAGKLPEGYFELRQARQEKGPE